MYQLQATYDQEVPHMYPQVNSSKMVHFPLQEKQSDIA